MSKVVITSIGVCHCIGMDLDLFSSGLQAGEKVKDDPFLVEESMLEKELSKYIEHSQTRRLDRFSKMALASALACSCRLNGISENYKNELGVVINTNMGALNSSEEFIRGALKSGIKNASPLIFPFTVPNAATGVITIHLGIRGFNTTISGYNPLGYAYDLLKLDRGKGFFVGGIEEYSEQFLKIKRANNLFYSNQISEGAGILFMTTDDFARANNLDVLFSIDNFSTACSMNELYTIDNSEIIEESTIESVLGDMYKSETDGQSDIHLVVSSFLPEDPMAIIEKKALSQLFQDNCPPVLYPKSWIGETLGAASTLNTIAGYCLANSRNVKGKVLISNYDIGGNYSCLTIKK